MKFARNTPFNDLAIVAGLCGLAAGTAEIIVGRASWTGNKDDPTTLGWVTIGLALVIATAALIAAHRPTATTRFAAGIAMMVAAAIGNTTAGKAWAPASIAAVAAGAAELIAASRQRSLRVVVAEIWPSILLVVLGSIYLTFGVVAGGPAALAGLGGAAAVCLALALGRRSRRGAALVLIVGVTPFAFIAVWTAVLPVTALLMLAVGLPTICARPPHADSSSHLERRTSSCRRLRRRSVVRPPNALG